MKHSQAQGRGRDGGRGEGCVPHSCSWSPVSSMPNVAEAALSAQPSIFAFDVLAWKWEAPGVNTFEFP